MNTAIVTVPDHEPQAADSSQVLSLPMDELINAGLVIKEGRRIRISADIEKPSEPAELACQGILGLGLLLGIAVCVATLVLPFGDNWFSRLRNILESCL